MYVAEIRITVLDKKENKPVAVELPINIDGIQTKQTVTRIVINRLLKSDGEQASIPIQTFLPFSTHDPSKY